MQDKGQQLADATGNQLGKLTYHLLNAPGRISSRLSSVLTPSASKLSDAYKQAAELARNKTAHLQRTLHGSSTSSSPSMPQIVGLDGQEIPGATVTSVPIVTVPASAAKAVTNGVVDIIDPSDPRYQQAAAGGAVTGAATTGSSSSGTPGVTVINPSSSSTSGATVINTTAAQDNSSGGTGNTNAPTPGAPSVEVINPADPRYAQLAAASASAHPAQVPTSSPAQPAAAQRYTSAAVARPSPAAAALTPASAAAPAVTKLDGPAAAKAAATAGKAWQLDFARAVANEASSAGVGAP